MTKQELEQRVASLEQIVLRAAAGPALQLHQPQQHQPIITPPPAPKKPRKTKTKAKTKAPTDIAPAVPLQAVDGALTPLNQVLKGLKPSVKCIEGVQPLMDGHYVLGRGGKPKKTAGVNAQNLRRVWSTIIHLRKNDPTGEAMNAEALKADLDDLKDWLHDDREFLAAINTNPNLAVFWFIDCWLAATGQMDDDDE